MLSWTHPFAGFLQTKRSRRRGCYPYHKSLGLLLLRPEEVRVDAFDIVAAHEGDAEVIFYHQACKLEPVDQGDFEVTYGRGILLGLPREGRGGDEDSLPGSLPADRPDERLDLLASDSTVLQSSAGVHTETTYTTVLQVSGCSCMRLGHMEMRAHLTSGGTRAFGVNRTDGTDRTLLRQGYGGQADGTDEGRVGVQRSRFRVQGGWCKVRREGKAAITRRTPRLAVRGGRVLMRGKG